MSTPPPPPFDRGPDAAQASEPLHVRWSPEEQAWTSGPLTPPADVPRRIGSPGWVHLLLLLLTFLTMTWAGAVFFLNYVNAVGLRRVVVPVSTALLGGLWFSVPALLILGSHELGHYFACRYYRIPASLPYFVPAFLPGIPGLWPSSPTLVGTLGAVIRMALPRTRRALFDVGIAGPLAGFVVLVPLAMYGVSHSYAVRLPHQLAVQGGLELGDPLLLTWLQRLYFGTLPDRSVFVMHPMGFAAWFGLLATALNLFPAGQLDGGHIVHAIVGRRSRYVTMASLLVMLGLTIFVSTSWVVWTFLILLMAYSFGLDHPPVGDEHVPIGATRLVLALVAVAMFVLSFTPVPISPMDFIGGR